MNVTTLRRRGAIVVQKLGSSPPEFNKYESKTEAHLISSQRKNISPDLLKKNEETGNSTII